MERRPFRYEISTVRDDLEPVTYRTDTLHVAQRMVAETLTFNGVILSIRADGLLYHFDPYETDSATLEKAGEILVDCAPRAAQSAAPEPFAPNQGSLF